MKNPNLTFTAFFAFLLLFSACKQEEFTVTFNPNGGTGVMESQTFKDEEAQQLSPNTFLREEYSFAGWNTQPDGNGNSYLDKQTITVSSNLTLYAQWDSLPPSIFYYYVTFYANGGSGNMEPQPFLPEEEKELTANSFSRPGFEFRHWNTKADGTGKNIPDRVEIELTEDLSLYAQWADPAAGGTPCPGTPTVTDITGNVYNTVQIGSQCWMRENLRATKYKTGETIPVITDMDEWYKLSTGAMCYYDNNIDYTKKYGALYNWFAVETGNICPTGWHVPNNEEWGIIINYLGGGNEAGYKMKSAYDWTYYNGNNESGFSALPAGYYHYMGYFVELGHTTRFWSSTEEYHCCLVGYGSEISVVNIFYYNLEFGLSIRCVKD
jgi:uncharacterized protein (TIGR02145 family)/uncharacterized repeat protein (TIGR02543 family)